jgi:TolB protein
MTQKLHAVGPLLLALGYFTLQAPQTPAPSQQAAPEQPSELSLILGESIGTQPRFAVPNFVALSDDAETAEIARTLAQVLWDDLDFEREFYMIPRDTYETIPPATSMTDVPFEAWREVGADGVLVGTVQKTGEMVQVRVRLFNVRGQDSVFGREYTGSVDNPRLYAHTIADEVHQNQRGLRGVARTKLTFASDRNGERIVGPVDNRTIKEVYMADYDGGNQRRVTVNRSLNITPVWSADGRAIAYTSYRRGFPDVFVSFIYEGRLETPAAGTPDEQNWLPAWSPDGRRIAFTSNRDGNPELYVIDADGGNLRRLTNNPAIDTSPTWSPTGTQLAFTSDRSGRPQIYVIGVDGTGIRRMTFESYCDRPTWSPAPFNEIAYSSRTGPGHDIKILELATGAVRQLTFGLGTNESPAYAPNGRHLAFTSTRSGGKQIFTMARDGRNLRRVTRAGNNEMANWSH